MMAFIYTQPQCQPCRLTKMKFDQLGIPYTEVPLTAEVAARARAAGHMSAPVISAEYGDDVTFSWSGYRPDYIKALQETLTTPG